MTAFCETKPLIERACGVAAGAAVGDAPLILVADDEEGSRAALIELLAEGGFRAVALEGGLELVRLVPVLRPAAVIMDLVMPDMDGLEAAAALRAEPGRARVPVVAITASWLGDRPDLLAQVGFDAALRKPFHPAELLDALRGVLLPDPVKLAV